jgi:hypothetical protein
LLRDERLAGRPRCELEVECGMNMAEYDARDVLNSYLGVLDKLGSGSICDVAQLDYPKDVIKYVLRHCIKTIAEVDKQSFLCSAYLSLANFHELSEEERVAARQLREIEASEDQSDPEKAARMRDAAASLWAAIERHKAELAILGQELKILQHDDPTTASAG